MSYIEVYKTNICCADRAAKLRALLLSYSSTCYISFDLEDADKIMRIEGPILPDMVKQLFSQVGLECAILE